MSLTDASIAVCSLSYRTCGNTLKVPYEHVRDISAEENVLISWNHLRCVPKGYSERLKTCRIPHMERKTGALRPKSTGIPGRRNDFPNTAPRNRHGGAIIEDDGKRF